MALDFMKPDVWDGLVVGTILIGLSLAVLRLMSDRAVYRRKQRSDMPDERRMHEQDHR